MCWEEEGKGIDEGEERGCWSRLGSWKGLKDGRMVVAGSNSSGSHVRSAAISLRDIVPGECDTLSVENKGRRRTDLGGLEQFGPVRDQ